jgi:CDP-diacylglycerol--serine O-phosphatidyltransferase
MQKYTDKKKTRKSRKQLPNIRKGVYILPNLLTSLSLFCGFYSIISTMKGAYVVASWSIIIAAVFDSLDGRIARITRTNSRFGEEYDSLCDLVGFGIAPAVLAYGLVLHNVGRWGWLAAFLFAACGAIRLARFNIRKNKVSTSFFQGLPIPAAACMVAVFVIIWFYFEFSNLFVLGICTSVIIYACALLMVSSIRYKSFKNIDLSNTKPFNAVVVAILMICVIASEPQMVLFILACLYVFSGPAGYLQYTIQKRRKILQSENQSDYQYIHEKEQK